MVGSLKVGMDYIQVLKKALRPLSKTYFSNFLKRFHQRYKLPIDRHILFAHGSTGDTFFMATLLSEFTIKYGQTTVIASKQHKNIFRLLADDIKVEFLWLEEADCQKLRRALDVTRMYEQQPLAAGIIRPLHLVLYTNITGLVKSYRTSLRDALTWIMGIDKGVPHKYVVYTSSDIADATAILSNAVQDLNKIALINPICYTHKNVTVNGWKGIADAFTACGYKPVFNVKGNVTDLNQHNIVPAGYPSVEIPAYLVPVCADLVGLACSRQGGGFDLLYAFNKKLDNTFLISLSQAIPHLPGEMTDAPYHFIREFYKEHCGKDVTYAVLLDSDDDEYEAYSKVLNALKGSI